MLFFSRWKAAAVLLTALAVCLFAVPNFLPEKTVQSWPKSLQWHVVRGLDLQGGSHLLLQVDADDVRKQTVEALRDDVRRVLRDARLQILNANVRGDSVEVRLRDSADASRALAGLRELSHPLGGFATGQRSVDITESGDGVIRLTTTEAAIAERIRRVIGQSSMIIERRVNALGTAEPSIQRQGLDRLLVQVPGFPDSSRLKDVIGPTAKLTFRFVNDSMDPQQALESGPPSDSEILYDKQGQPYLIEKQVMVEGVDLIDAQAEFDSEGAGEPIVTFRFNTNGARKFRQATASEGRYFAIVLDKEVISAPRIDQTIPNGSGFIRGKFTVERANDLAIVLRSGALPARLTIIEERTVGPGLGQDSIEKGKLASYAGSALVVAFMLATYGLFGLFASIAVAINVAMIFGVLSLLTATLTLPGIAGIVLTVGIAVDSNVLIYERIREEVRSGRTPMTAIDAGFTRALATILDSNITTFIAAAVLFFIGTGAVRGFAVTLGIGIVTTVFTAFTLTRLIIASWVRWWRPRYVPI